MGLREKLIDTKSNLKRVQVDLPEFDQPVFVREMTGRERHEYQLTIESSRDEDENLPSFYPLMFKLVQLVTEDEDRASVFKPDDLDAIQQIPSRIIEAIYTQASIVSGLLKKESEDEDDSDELDDGEDEELKNVAGAAGEIS
jgi:hypothetical protein